MDKLSSRFFTNEDSKTDFFVYDLPETWWSRKYEYEWAKNFVEQNDVVLDAASGVFHPLKFYLANTCKEVYACDLDESIEVENLAQIDKKILDENSINYEQLGKITEILSTKKIHNKRCSITKLPYEDNKFDKIFCISVLEHLDDRFNKKYNRFKPLIPFMKFINPKDLFEAMKEFKRVLKEDGTIILTFDYPNISLEYFKKILELLDLEFVSDYNFELPQNAIYSEVYERYCFRAVIKKK